MKRKNFFKNLTTKASALTLAFIMTFAGALPTQITAQAAVTEYENIPWAGTLSWATDKGDKVDASKLQYQVTTQKYTANSAKTVSQLIADVKPTETVGKLCTFAKVASLSPSYKQKKDKKGNVITTMTCYKIQIFAPFISECNSEIDYTSEATDIEKSDLEGEDPWLVILNTPTQIGKKKSGKFSFALGAAYDGEQQTIEAEMTIKMKKNGGDVACKAVQYGDEKLTVSDVDRNGGCDLDNIVYKTGFIIQFTLQVTPQVDKAYK